MRAGGATRPVRPLRIASSYSVPIERAATGRRLFLDIRAGIIYRTNFLGLTQVL